ncbi:Fc.00g010650.m01.CDS01 [Cosmosporella sp. VM-42]
MNSEGKPSGAFDGPGRIDAHHHCFPKTVKELRSEFEHDFYNLNYAPIAQGPEEHLEHMNEVNIQTAVITPSIKREWHEQLSATEFETLCRRSLEAQISYVPIIHYDSVGSFAILPLPHVQESINLICYAMKLKAPPDGFAVATAMGKKYLGDHYFDIVWEKLDKHGLVVFAHPSDTAMPPSLNFRPYQALDYIASFVVSNDYYSKGFDKYASLGPLLVSLKVVGAADNLAIQTWVNSELRQDSNTANLFFGVKEIIAFISQETTVRKGTTVMTGTPSGVAMGMKPESKYLSNGDIVNIRIEGLGMLENKILFE